MELYRLSIDIRSKSKNIIAIICMQFIQKRIGIFPKIHINPKPPENESSINIIQPTIIIKNT